jgi:hypothetical protein
MDSLYCWLFVLNITIRICAFCIYTGQLIGTSKQVNEVGHDFVKGLPYVCIENISEVGAVNMLIISNLLSPPSHTHTHTHTHTHARTHAHTHTHAHGKVITFVGTVYSLKSETVKYGRMSQGTRTEKDCAGKGQRHTQKTDPSSRQRGRPTESRT